MKENKKDVEVIEETEVENVQSEETKKENIFTKGANFVKRNGNNFIHRPNLKQLIGRFKNYSQRRIAVA